MVLRFYLFPNEGAPLRLSHRIVNDARQDALYLPQYANSRQRILTLYLATEDGKPTEIREADGSIWVFNENGGIREGIQAALALVMNVGFEGLPPSVGNVIDLMPRHDKRKLKEEYRWQPSRVDLDRVAADLWPKSKADRLKSVVAGKAPPRMTYDASHALKEISSHFWKIGHEITSLKETSQRAFGHEARKLSQNSSDEFAHLYRALADMSDWELESQKRLRTGDGVWYAVVEVMTWRDRTGELVQQHHERCDGRANAVVAARRLLAEHAAKFSEDVRVEADVVNELEWERRALNE